MKITSVENIFSRQNPWMFQRVNSVWIMVIVQEHFWLLTVKINRPLEGIFKINVLTFVYKFERT